METINECLKDVAAELKTEENDFTGILNTEDVIDIKIAEKDLEDRWDKPIEDIKFTFMFSKVVNEKCCSTGKYLDVIDEKNEYGCINLLKAVLKKENRNYYVTTLFTTKKGFIYLPLFKISRIVKEYSEEHNQDVYYLYIKETTKDDFKEISDMDLSNRVFELMNRLRTELLTKKFFLSHSSFTKMDTNFKHNIHVFFLNIVTSLETGALEVYGELTNDEVDLITNNLQFKIENMLSYTFLKLFNVPNVSEVIKRIFKIWNELFNKEVFEKENN